MTNKTVVFPKLLRCRFIVAYLICTVTFSVLNDAFAQRSMEFEQLSFEQGVASNWVFDIVEDDTGFVWFAGFSGLTRHDGLVNKNYTHLPNDTSSLSINHLRRLMTLPDGRIICSTIGGGLCIYNSIHDNFRRINRTTHPNLPTEFIAAGIRHYDDDILYLAGRPRSILRFNPFDSLPDFEEFPLDAESRTGYFRENKTRDILPDMRDSSKYWIVGNYRIYSFDAESNAVQLEKEFEQLMDYNTHFELIHCVHMIDKDHLLLKLDNYGFHRFNLRNKQLEFLAPDPATAPFRSVSICPSSRGGYWIGANNGQLFFAEPGFGDITEIHIEKADINHSYIECIYETVNGELYIGTNGAGVLKHHPSSNRFRILKPVLTDSAEVQTESEWTSLDNFNRGILHPKFPLYYINSYNYPGKLFLLNIRSERIGFLNTTDIDNIERGNFARGPENKVVTHNMSALFETDSSGRNVLPFDWTLYGGQAPSLPEEIRHLTFGEDGRLLISGPGYLYLVTPDYQNPKIFTHKLNLLQGYWEEVIFESNRITMLSEEAVFEWDVDKNELTQLHFTSEFSPEKKIMRGFSKRDSAIFITSTLHGVIQFKREGDTLKVVHQFSPPKDILSNNIYSSRMDSDGYIWLSTALGYERFDPTGKSSVRFGYRQNLPRLYRDNPFFINDAGIFASHGHKDLVYGRIDELLHINTSGNLLLHTFEVDGRNMMTQFPDSQNGISLGHKQNNLVMGWSHTKSSSSDFYRSEYMLRGFDKAYQSAGNLYSAHYTNVPPGDYHFEVSIRSVMDGSEIHHRSVPVSIAPPWWDTLLFKLCVAFILLLAIYGIFRLRLNAVRKEQALISTYNQQLVEMEMQFLRAQMNPHFMFNSLNSIKHFILLNKKEEAVEYLSKFAQLIRSILQYSSLSYISLQEELSTLKTYIELEQARFSGGFEFEIEVDPGLDLSEIVLQPLIFQPYVENAIWHGLMHKERDRLLKIVLSKSNEQLVCEVIDNGIGREQSRNIRSKTSTRKSMGLPISEKRMKAQDASANVHITDLKNADGSTAGTKVTICLPLKFRDH